MLAARMVDTVARTRKTAADDLARWSTFSPRDRATMPFDTTPHLKDGGLPAERREAWQCRPVLDPLTIRRFKNRRRTRASHPSYGTDP